MSESDSATLTALDLDVTDLSQYSLPAGDNHPVEANARQHSTSASDRQGVEANNDSCPQPPEFGPLAFLAKPGGTQGSADCRIQTVADTR